MDVVVRTGRRRAVTAIALLALAIPACGKKKAAVAETSFREVSSNCETSAVKNRFIVKWKDGSISVEGAKDRDAFLEDVLEPNSDDIEFAENDQVVRVERPRLEVVQNAFTGNDWGQQAVRAPELWAANIDGAGVTVAVIDSGVDVTHPQIRNQLAVNENEIANGLDDDGNGLVDDVAGYDFESERGTVGDGTGHGTHVSGIIIAQHSAGTVKGVAPGAKLLPLDFMDDDGAGSISAAIRAIDYAVDRGAKVINASWGGGECSEALRQTVAKLEAKGVLFVVAAGNSGSRLESFPEYPAAFPAVSQLTIAASSTRDLLAGFSNYSYDLVHLAAPGVSIVSTVPDGGTQALSGTSMAAPFVSAAAAILFSRHPDASVASVRETLMQSVDRHPSEPKGVLPVVSGGRLNIPAALRLLDERMAPAAVR